MKEDIYSQDQAAHFFDHIKGILYLENGRTFNVGQVQVVEDIHTSISRIKHRFIQAGKMGVNDIITAAL